MDQFKDKSITLKDGTGIVLRSMRIDDLDRSFEFFSSFPNEIRRYLRMDVTRKENIRKRIEMMNSGFAHRIVAEYEDRIVADGGLELSHWEWDAHIGEMRVLVAGDFQRKGLGMILIRELYFLAVSLKLEGVVARMMRTQETAIKMCKKLGFREQVMLPNFVKDLEGTPQDLIIMKCNLKDMWEEMEIYFRITDMRTHR